MHVPRLIVALAIIAFASSLSAQVHAAARPQFTGRVRVYYIAADEVDWTYVPSRADQAMTGKKDDYSKDPAAKGTLDPNATTYRKALYREYTDSSFKAPKTRPDAWAQL